MFDCDNAFAWSIKDSCDHFGDHFVGIGGVRHWHYEKPVAMGQVICGNQLKKKWNQPANFSECIYFYYSAHNSQEWMNFYFYELLT